MGRRASLAWFCLIVAACAPIAPPADQIVLRPAAFADLNGWSQDAPAGALAAFVRSCVRIMRLQPEPPLDGHPMAGKAADWQAVCADAPRVAAGDDAAARQFFETRFRPFRILNNDRGEGLFTGYYEPTLKGSRARSDRFGIPLYRRPDDLVTIDLGLFREQLKGQRLAGRVIDGQLRPYPDRAAIETGGLAGRGLELVWVDSAVDAFFLHIQGSGRIELDDGAVLRVGYAAQNGHAYTALGRILADEGLLARDGISMQTIRAWLAAHPDRAGAMMRRNASFVFFRLLDGNGPLGADGTVLTPGRSIAVDRKFMPLGVPLWLETSQPAAAPGAADLPLRRLVVAQDTGGALRGPVRGDVFFGPGAEAAEIAGRMQHQGRYWLLLPKPVAERTAAAR